MASNATVEAVHIETYEDNVRFLAQQMISRVRPWVMERGTNGEGHNWERLGTQEATLKTPVGGPTGRNVATPEDNYPFTRRRSTPGTWHTGDTTEPEDLVKVLIDPNSSIARAQAMAMRRAVDDELFDAAERDADDGNGGTVSLPAGQIIGDGSANITFDDVTAVTEQFLNNDVDQDEEKVWFLDPGNVRKLLQLTEFTSADYNSMRPLETGQIVKHMGFTWVPSTRLNIPSAGEVNNVIMTRKALGLQVNEDITARVQEDPTISFAWRIYCRATFGAVRVEDEHIMLGHFATAV